MQKREERTYASGSLINYYTIRYEETRRREKFNSWKENHSQWKKPIEFKTYLWINFRPPPPPRGVYSLRIVVTKDHLTGEETGAMENNEIFVGKGEREEEEGVIEEKSATHLVLEYEILSNCVENKKTRKPSRRKTRLKFHVIGDNTEAGYD